MKAGLSFCCRYEVVLVSDHYFLLVGSVGYEQPDKISNQFINRPTARAVRAVFNYGE
jgi:hypothetical protein